MTGERLYIEGLKEFRAALRDAGKDIAKELQIENKALANDVAGQVRGAYGALHASRSGYGANSIRSSATGVSAAVVIGSDRAPYILGQEFGSRQGPRKKQFPPYVPSPTGRGGRGYFLYPTLNAVVPTMLKRYLAALDRVKAFAAGRA